MRRALETALIAGMALMTGTAARGQAAQTRAEKSKSELSQALQRQRDAKTIFDREMSREKAGDCPKADNTRALNQCLSGEIGATRANYKAYMGVLRSMLEARGDNDLTGPTGKPLSGAALVKQFDEVAAMWETYRQAQCSAAFDNYKGGTLASTMEARCELLLLRSHMRDVDRIYYDLLHH